MPSVTISSPVSIPVVLQSNGAGGWLLPSTQGKARPCIQPNEVWALVYDDPSKRQAAPHGNAKQVLAQDLIVPQPPPWCAMSDNTWTVREVPGAQEGEFNFLRVWVKFQNDATWYTADSDFTGVVQTYGPPAPAPAPALAAARAIVAGAAGAAGGAPPTLVLTWQFGILSTSELSFPYNLSQMVGLLGFPVQELGFDFASPDNDPVWTLGDPHAGPHWRLRLLGSGIARLRLRLNLGGNVVQQYWNCAAFDQTAGGVFEPDSSNVMMERMEIWLP